MTDDPLTAALDRLQTLADAATGGPWTTDREYGEVYAAEDRWVAQAYGDDVGANAEFIAASRTALPVLIEAVRAVLALSQVPEGDEGAVDEWGVGFNDGVVRAAFAIRDTLAPLTAAHTEAER